MPTQSKQKSRGGAWLATAASIYAATTVGGIGTATWLDATRAPPAVVRVEPQPPRIGDPRIVVPPDALAPEPTLPPCPADAVVKPEQDSPASASGEVGTVGTGELNVRATPGGRIVGQLFRGDQVDVLERRVNGGGIEWVRTKGGWVAARFLTTAAVEPPTPAQAELPCFLPQQLCLPGTKSVFTPTN